MHIRVTNYSIYKWYSADLHHVFYKEAHIAETSHMHIKDKIALGIKDVEANLMKSTVLVYSYVQVYCNMENEAQRNDN